MFDPSFFELIIICVVALLVLGPDRLPGAIKTLGLWIGRLRRSFNNIKREIEQEVGADEIRRQLRNEAIMEKFNNTKSQITESIDSVKKEAESVKDDLDLTKGLSELADESSKYSEDETGKTADMKDTIDPEHSVDPIDKLPTNDPAARQTQPTPEHHPASEPASEDSADTQNDDKSDK